MTGAVIADTPPVLSDGRTLKLHRWATFGEGSNMQSLPYFGRMRLLITSLASETKAITPCVAVSPFAKEILVNPFYLDCATDPHTNVMFDH